MVCRECQYGKVAYEGNIWCLLGHAFVEKLGDFCPKEHNVKEIRESCYWYESTETMKDGFSACLAQLADARVLPCKVVRKRDLLGDPDFKLKEKGAAHAS